MKEWFAAGLRWHERSVPWKGRPGIKVMKREGGGGWGYQEMADRLLAPNKTVTKQTDGSGRDGWIV